MAEPHNEPTSIEDRISELPEYIRQHIVSFLPTKQAIATSTLSSTWKYDWINSRCINFSANHFRCPEEFVKHLDDVLQYRKKHFPRLQVEKLYLHLPYLRFSSLRSMALTVIDQWLQFIAGQQLGELSFHVYNVGGDPFPTTLDLRVFASLSLITKLDLYGCILDTMESGSLLPLLKELTLTRVRVHEYQIFKSLLENCALVEKLRLRKLGFLPELFKVSGLSRLKDVEIDLNENTKRVEIDSDIPNLIRLFVSWGSSYQNSIYVHPSCKNLVVLQLINCKMKDNEMNPLLAQLSNLKVLRLEGCKMLVSIIVPSNRLVNLTIKQCGRLCELQLDSPGNMQSLELHIPYIIISIRSTTPLAPFSSTIHFPDMRDVLCHQKTFALLGTLSHSREVSLLLGNRRNKVISSWTRLTELCPHPLHGIEHLKLSISRFATPEELVEWLDSLLWFSPCPKFIHISNIWDSSFNLLIEIQYKEEAGNENGCGCYPSLPINCWRHSMKEIKILKSGFNAYPRLIRNFFSSNRFFDDIDCGILVPRRRFPVRIV